MIGENFAHYRVTGKLGAGGIEFLIRVKPFLEGDRQPLL